MKKQFGTSRFVLGVLVIIGALAVASTASAKNPKEVKMTIESNKLIMKTPNNANDCSGWQRRGPGCIRVLKNEKSDILFHLTGDTKCDLENGTEWELNAVYLGGYESTSKPGASGFGSTDDDDYDKVNSDFNITDRASGRVTLSEKSAKKLVINDLNQHKYVVWYKVEAICERTDGKPAHVTTMDPRARNGGTE